MKKVLFFALLNVVVFACNPEKRELKRILSEWQGKEIVFPELAAKFMGKDTVVSDMFQHDFKILNYVDTTGCTACRLHLFDWRVFMKELDTLAVDVSVLFVVFSKDYVEFEEIQWNNLFKYPVFYDSTGMLNHINKFPFRPQVLHTFLLDKDNKVLAIGNPVKNGAVCKLYKKIITGQIGIE